MRMLCLNGRDGAHGALLVLGKRMPSSAPVLGNLVHGEHGAGGYLGGMEYEVNNIFLFELLLHSGWLNSLLV